MPLSVRIAQAGLSWSKRQFFAISAGIGMATFMLALLTNGGLIIAGTLGFVGAFGLPRWMLSYFKKRRESKFLDAFPDAVDIIVRGVKAGLPLLDCLKMITAEAPEPVNSEFRAIVETQAIGMPLGEACGKLYEHMPVPEANFFGIVVSIQQRSGGNLAEALGNLSRVLRDRKKMKAKIQAMSQEAKASASIIGALPVAVMTMVYITQSQLHLATVDRAARPRDARRFRRVDVDGHHGDEENDQFRLLAHDTGMWTPGFHKDHAPLNDVGYRCSTC